MRAGEAAPRPNIIFILADDLGAETLNCYGGVKLQRPGAFKTPNIDALAEQGMRFKFCFANPVCSPSRAELLTGKYPFRTGIIDVTGRNGAVGSLDFNAHPTLAARLKGAGYVTAAVGKWHIGQPLQQEIPATSLKDTNYPHVRSCGFDRQCVFGGHHLALYGPPKAGEYTPDKLQDWTLRFLESRRDKKEPFFLYYASPIPHSPVLPTPLNPDAKKGDARNLAFVIEYLDKQVGEITRKIDELGMGKNTIIMFSGDNGTYKGVVTVMRDGRTIRGGKATMQDTGSWVPLIARWTGTVPAKSTYDGLVDFTDILPTCMELAGGKATGKLDGQSFAPQLMGKAGMPREWIYVHWVKEYFVRDARYRLHENGHLFDISESPYVERRIMPDQETPQSKMARERLGAVLRKLHE
jgi:arylsulfatase A